MKGLEEPKTEEGKGGQTELDFSMTAEERQAFATGIRRKMLTGEELTPEEQRFVDADRKLFGRDNNHRHPEV